MINTQELRIRNWVIWNEDQTYMRIGPTSFLLKDNSFSPIPLTHKNRIMKEINNYLHLYLGCEVIGKYNEVERKGYLTGVTNGGYNCEIQFFEDDGVNVFEEPEFNDCYELKLILRPLSDMTNEERKETMNLNKSGIYEKVRYWLSRHFDLFGLIEADLAIDKTTLK